MHAALAAAALASFATARAAEVARERTPSTYAAAQELAPIDALHAMDADRDGRVTREEFMKFQEALFAGMDRNGDRRLSAPEFTDRGQRPRLAGARAPRLPAAGASDARSGRSGAARDPGRVPGRAARAGTPGDPQPSAVRRSGGS